MSNHVNSSGDEKNSKSVDESIEKSFNIYTTSQFTSSKIIKCSQSVDSTSITNDDKDHNNATGDGNNNISSNNSFKSSSSLGTPFVMDEPMKQKIAKYEQFFREKFASKNQQNFLTPSRAPIYSPIIITNHHKDTKSLSRVDVNSLDTVTGKCNENKGAQKSFSLLQHDHRKLKQSLSPKASVENINRGLLDRFIDQKQQQQPQQQENEECDSSSLVHSPLEKNVSPVIQSTSIPPTDCTVDSSSTLNPTISMKSTVCVPRTSVKPAIAPKPRNNASNVTDSVVNSDKTHTNEENARKLLTVKSKDDCDKLPETSPFKSRQFRYLSLRKYSSPIFKSLRSKVHCKCSSVSPSQCRCKSSKVSTSATITTSSFSPLREAVDVNDQSTGNKDTSYLITNRRQSSLISPCDTLIAELKQKLLTNPPRLHSSESNVSPQLNSFNSSSELVSTHFQLNTSPTSSCYSTLSGTKRKIIKKQRNKLTHLIGTMNDDGFPDDTRVPNMSHDISIDSESDCDSYCTDNVCQDDDDVDMKQFSLNYRRSDASQRSTSSRVSATCHLKDNSSGKNRFNDRRLSSFSLSSSSTCSSFKSTPPASPYLSNGRSNKSLELDKFKTNSYQVNQVSSGSTSGSNSTITSSSAANDTASKASDSSSIELTPQAKKLRKLYYIASELTTTEGQFVDKMNLLAVELREIAEKHLPKEMISEMFKYLDVLRNVSSHLYKELEDALESYPSTHKIAHVLVHIGPFLNCYSCFMVEFEKLKSTYEDALRRYPAFASQVKEFEASPRCEKLSIQHFFLKPVQRIPQYRLLFEDYLKNLPEDHEDYDDALKALAIVSTVAEHANKVIKEGDSFMKLLSIQNSLFPSKEIIKPGRIFIKQDDLMKVSRKELQLRRVVLCSDCLLYLTLLQSGLYRLNHEISLEGMRLSIDKEEHSAFNNELTIMSPVRSLILKAKSTSERDSWYNAIRSAIDDFNSRKRTFKQNRSGSFIDSPKDYPDSSIKQMRAIDSSDKDHISNDSVPSSPVLGDECPIWIPDDRVTMCQQCSCEFSAFFRRHHCRACGKVICRQCSANRVPLKYREFKLSRVCDVCFDTLKKMIEDKKNTRSQFLRNNSILEDSTKIASSPVIIIDNDEGDKVNNNNNNNKSNRMLHPSVSVTSNNGDTASENEFDELLMQFTRIPVRLSRRKPKVKATLKVNGNDVSSDLRGYLHMKVKKSKTKRYWFIVKDKILYRFNASDDVAALHSCPLLGWELKLSTESLDNHPADTVFHLLHEGLPTMTFAAESLEQRDLWVNVISASFVL